MGDQIKAYESLLEEEKEKIRTILYFMDRFSLSLKRYHELTQVEKALPRTHLMESCARTQDRKWNVQRTPGRAQGAELPFKRLLEKEVGNFVSFMSLINLFIHATENTVTYGTTIQALLIFFACLKSNTLLILQVKNNADGTTKVKVKISGDGTRISHSSNLFVCSFALVEDGKRCLSSAGTLSTILLL